MRILNYTRGRVDRDLWRQVARELGLAGALPAAAGDDLGLYSRKHLLVQVRPAPVGEKAGWYCWGEIRIHRCRYCTAARLFWTFCHELTHAWFDSYRPERYFHRGIEAAADRFADAMLASAGGAVGHPDRCGSYRWPRAPARRLDPGVVARGRERFLARPGRGG